jgi:peptide-methionine (S)-S-oxide reductase
MSNITDTIRNIRWTVAVILIALVIAPAGAMASRERGEADGTGGPEYGTREDNPRLADAPRGAAAVAAATGITEGEFSIPPRDSETMWRTDRDFEGAAYLTLGGGCFWCVEAVYDNVPGVIDAISGYAGGTVPNPAYEQVISGRTGHAEVVRIAYDPEVTDVETLLEVFWKSHNPTTPNRQGNDIGTQYRSIILHENETDGEIALRSMQAMNTTGLYGRPAVTQIEPLEAFYPAEEYHQDYFAKNPGEGYCTVVIAPKLQSLFSEGIIGL